MAPINCKLKKNQNNARCIYHREDLKTDIDWFEGLGVDKSEAKSFIGSLLNKRKQRG